MRLADVAPRLAAARDAHEALMRERRDARIAHMHRELTAEALVAHREMVLLRHSPARNPRWWERRRRLLEEARAELASIRARGPREPPL